MNRREFLKYTAVGGAGSAYWAANGFSAVSDGGRESVRWNGGELPLLFDVDVLILGGGFAGLSVAANVSARGKKVAVLDSKTFLGDEITAYLNFAMDFDEGPLPEPIAKCKACSIVANGRRQVKNDDIKRELEAMLGQAGAAFLYNTSPVHIAAEGPGYLVVVANKSGFQVVRTRAILDGTPMSVTSFLMEGSRPSRFGKHAAIGIEMIEVKEAGDALEVPDFLQVADNRIRMNQGYVNAGHLFLEFSRRLSAEGNPVEIRALSEISAGLQLQAYEVVKYLVNNLVEFEGASYARLSYYVKFDRLAEQPVFPPWLGGAKPGKKIGAGGKVFDAGEFAGEYPNTWILPPHRFDYSALTAASVGDLLASHILEAIPSAGAKVSGKATASGKSLPDVRSSDRRHEARNFPKHGVGSFDVPFLADYELIVAGGGTSGGLASVTAANEGLRALVVDGNRGLGGTGTFGGVNGYYYGREEGPSNELDHRVQQAEAEINFVRTKGRWNPEVKNYVLIKEAARARTDLFFHSFVSGVMAEGGKIKGLILATPCGVCAVTASLLIDATGDGDVAAFAGADYVHGSASGFPMYFSLGLVRTPGSFSSGYLSLVDNRNVHDMHRVFVGARRDGSRGQRYDQATYLAPRESRHIKGEATISLTDLLTHRQWPDVVNIHFCNNDLVGHQSSDWLRIGLLPPNIEVEVPLRALIPIGLENILVVGKAFSARHDVFPSLRVQRDLENLGAAAALACSLALKSRRRLRELDIGELQKTLANQDILPPEIPGRKVRADSHENYRDEEIARLIEQLDGEKPLQLYSDMDAKAVFRERMPFVELCLLQGRAVPHLERAMDGSSGGKKILLAKALAFIGAKSAVDVLAARIAVNLAPGVLPARTEEISHASPTMMLPNQAAMPETAYLLNALAMCRDERALPLWRTLADIVRRTEIDLKDVRKGVFYYIEAVCYGAELLGRAEAIPILEDLHRNPMFNSQSSRTTSGMNAVDEKRAMLESLIGTALARSGSKRGFAILIDYLDDNRAVLAEYAHKSLKLVQREDFGKNKGRWLEWLERMGPKIALSPIRERADG